MRVSQVAEAWLPLLHSGSFPMDELISQPKNNLTTRKLSCGPAQARRRNLHLGRKSTVHTVRPSLACMHAWWREAQAQESLPGPPQSSKACRTKHKPGRPRAVETRSSIVTIVYLSLRPCHRISVCLTITGSVNIRYQRFEPQFALFLAIAREQAAPATPLWPRVLGHTWVEPRRVWSSWFTRFQFSRAPVVAFTEDLPVSPAWSSFPKNCWATKTFARTWRCRVEAANRKADSLTPLV